MAVTFEGRLTKIEKEASENNTELNDKINTLNEALEIANVNHIAHENRI